MTGVVTGTMRRIHSHVTIHKMFRHSIWVFDKYKIWKVNNVLKYE